MFSSGETATWVSMYMASGARRMLHMLVAGNSGSYKSCGIWIANKIYIQTIHSEKVNYMIAQETVGHTSTSSQ